MLPAQRDHLDEARLLLDEQTLPPVDREASEEALDAIAAELAKDDGDEAAIKAQIEILRKTAPPIAEFLLKTPPSQPAKLTPQATFRSGGQVATMAFGDALAALDEMTLSPVDREAVEDALIALREETGEVKAHLAVIKHIAPGILRVLRGREE